MNFLPLIIQLVSGAVGGNVAGAVLSKDSLGTIGNSVVGILGGGLGGYILSFFGIGAGGETLDITNILSSIAGGGVGGGVLLTVIGIIKKLISKKA